MPGLDIQHLWIKRHSEAIGRPAIEFPQVEVNIVIPNKGNPSLDIILQKRSLSPGIEIVIIPAFEFPGNARNIPIEKVDDGIGIGQPRGISHQAFPVNGIEIDIRKTVDNLVNHLGCLVILDKRKHIADRSSHRCLPGPDLAADIDNITHPLPDPVPGIGTGRSKPLPIAELESESEKKNIDKAVDRYQT
jgi:hypothetical protein